MNSDSTGVLSSSSYVSVPLSSFELLQNVSEPLSSFELLQTSVIVLDVGMTFSSINRNAISLICAVLKEVEDDSDWMLLSDVE